MDIGHTLKKGCSFGQVCLVSWVTQTILAPFLNEVMVYCREFSYYFRQKPKQGVSFLEYANSNILKYFLKHQDWLMPKDVEGCFNGGNMQTDINTFFLNTFYLYVSSWNKTIAREKQSILYGWNLFLHICQFFLISRKGIRTTYEVIYCKARNDGARICKENPRVFREKNPRKSISWNLLVTPAKRLVAHTSARFEIRVRFYGIFRVQGYSCTYLKIHRWAKKYCKGNLNVSLPVYFLYFSEHSASVYCTPYRWICKE
jgi:hypothetical protein